MPAPLRFTHVVLAGLLTVCASRSLSAQEYDNRLVPTARTPVKTEAKDAVYHPVEPSAPIVKCPSTGPRWHSPWTWFRQKPCDGVVAQCESAASGCNIHPEPPFGASYQAFTQLQIVKGQAALTVLHHYDFEQDQAELNFRGRQRLHTIAERAVRFGHPIVVEASRDNLQLDSARRAHVLTELSALPYDIDEGQVVIGFARTRGLDGLDAELIHQNLLQQTSAGGQSATATTGPGMAVPVAR